MNWPGFVTPLNALLFALIVPLVALYFLKLKRPRLSVPSLVLWQSVLNDDRVNSPFQRFKRNLLLWLQLAVLMLLVLAAMQPYFVGGAESADYLPVLIDCSASMSAVDEPGGPTRLERAKEEVREIIDNLLPGQRLSLIAVEGSARRLTEFTDNRRILSDALDRLQPVDVPTQLEDGLRLAQGLTRTVPVEKVRLYSDGNLPLSLAPGSEQVAAIVNVDLPFELEYHRIEGSAPNIGITEFNAQRANDATWNVFARVETGPAGALGGRLTLIRDGEAIGEEEVYLESGQAQRLVFEVESESTAQLELKLQPDAFDGLAADNVAFLDLPEPRPLIVGCPEHLTTFRRALAELPDLELMATTDIADVVFTDALEDADSEAAVLVTTGVLPRDLEELLSVESGLAEIVDWKRDDPLLQYVHLGDVQITDVPTYSGDADEAALEEIGYRVIAHGAAGPLILSRQAGPQLRYHLLFHTDHSTLPFRVGFPVMVQNALNLARSLADLSEVRGINTGVVSERLMNEDGQFTVRGPAETVTLTADEAGYLRGIPARASGRYEITRSGRTVDSFGASLLSAAETRLTGVEEIQFAEVPVSAVGDAARIDRPFWRALVFLGLVLLLVEWWFYQRKPIFRTT